MKHHYDKPDHQSYPLLGTLYFYLTEGCNLKCRHCWINPTFKSTKDPGTTLDPDLFKRIMQEAKPLGLHTVKLTGGEPLLHPQFLDILSIIQKEDMAFILETNGLLCNTFVADTIASLKKPFVAVSLDGSNAATHEWVRNVPGSFDKAIQGIKNLVRAGIKTQIIMSVLRKNVKQIEAVLHLAEELEVESLKFNIITPTARGEKLHETGEVLTIKELVEIGHWIESDLASSTRLRICHSHPLAFRPLHRLFQRNYKNGICGILGILGVLSNGSFALCGIGEVVSELVLGQAGQDCLEKIWRDSPILNELRAGISHRHKGICAECLMKKKCFGSCIAQNYYRHRDLWAPFWYCEAADMAGLFPESRRVPESHLKAVNG